MNINIEAKNLDITPSLRIYIEKKFAVFVRSLKNFEKQQSWDIWLELERTTRHHRKGDVFRAEAILRLPKKSLRAQKNSSDLRSAIDFVKNKLKVEFGKYKSQLKEKRLKRAIKNI